MVFVKEAREAETLPTSAGVGVCFEDRTVSSARMALDCRRAEL